MRNLLPVLLGVILGATAYPLLDAAIPEAWAGDRSSDWILTIDRPTANGPVLRRLSYGQHVDVSASDWPAMRAAAAQSLSALDGWMAQKGWQGWWQGFPQHEREGARQAALLGS